MGFPRRSFQVRSLADPVTSPAAALLAPRPARRTRKPGQQPLQAPSPMTVFRPGEFAVSIPGMRLVNPLNAWEHWRVRSKRQAREKATVSMVLGQRMPQGLVPPMRVTLTRCYSARSKAMDSDAVPAAFKSVRDQVATWLGCDDGPTAGIDWRYADERAADFAVVIHVVALAVAGLPYDVAGTPAPP